MGSSWELRYMKSFVFMADSQADALEDMANHLRGADAASGFEPHSVSVSLSAKSHSEDDMEDEWQGILTYESA